MNECASNGGLGLCQQICTNTVGSYYCSCLLGYTLSANGASCNGEHVSHMATLCVINAIQCRCNSVSVTCCATPVPRPNVTRNHPNVGSGYETTAAPASLVCGVWSHT